MDRRTFFKLSLGTAMGTVFTGTGLKTAREMESIVHTKEGSTNNNQALHEKILEFANPTFTEAVTSIYSQLQEASLLINKNIEKNNSAGLSQADIIYSNADKWASAITAAPIWALSLGSRNLADHISQELNINKPQQSSLSTMFAYNTQTACICYIKNFLVEALRTALIKEMESNNTLDPRYVNSESIFKHLKKNKESLREKFLENLKSINQIPETFKDSSNTRKFLDLASIIGGISTSSINTGLGKLINSIHRQRVVGENALKKETKDSENYYNQAEIAIANAITYPMFNAINALCQEFVRQGIRIDTKSELAETNLRELVGNLVGFCGYMVFKVGKQHDLEYSIHKQMQEKTLESPYKEILGLMKPKVHIAKQN